MQVKVVGKGKALKIVLHRWKPIKVLPAHRALSRIPSRYCRRLAPTKHSPMQTPTSRKMSPRGLAFSLKGA